MRTAALSATAARQAERVLSPFEFWPGWLFYAPVVIQWIALGLWHRDLSLPTATNPRIETGGLCGERKSELLDQVSGAARARVAPYVLVAASATVAEAEAALYRAELTYPVVLKPDIGCNGTGVRLLAGTADLATALPLYPRDVHLVLQRYVAWEGEAGLFYVREPGEARGRLTSLTLKHAPAVVGDGRRTLRELVLADPRAGVVPHLYLPRLAGRLDSVPPSGDVVRLVLTGNHCKGSVFRDGCDQITPAMTDAVEAVLRSLPDFHFGRIDVRYRSLSALRRGEDFAIIEINGAGSEATHIWDARTTFWKAQRDQLRQFAAAWRIGAANRRAGFKSSGLRAMYVAWRRQVRLMASYPVND